MLPGLPGGVVMIRLTLACALALSASGCASITRGTTEQVTVSSEPAGAEVRTSMMHHCPATPCTFTVKRKDEFIVTIRKDGYEEAQVPVATRIAGGGAAGFAGNVIFGGVIGMGVDAASGATLEHFPNPVFVQLQPIGPQVPTILRKPPPPPAISGLSSKPLS
jgi:PEGA domain